MAIGANVLNVNAVLSQKGIKSKAIMVVFSALTSVFHTVPKHGVHMNVVPRSTMNTNDGTEN